jgi:hypothetical protein
VKIFAANAFKFLPVRLLVHEASRLLTALCIGLFALNLGLKLGTLADCALAVDVSGDALFAIRIHSFHNKSKRDNRAFCAAYGATAARFALAAKPNGERKWRV